jgi:hypothetical protein
MKHRRFLSALLLAALLSGSFAACSEEKENTDAQSGGSAGTEQSEADPQEGPVEVEPETELLTADLPEDLDYGGETVVIMQHPFQGGDWSDWLSRDLFSEGFNGEPVNDAVYSRNIAVEDRLNVHLDVQDVANMPDAIMRQVKAGTGDYNISTARIQSLPNTVLSGYLTDLNRMPRMDLSKPWYDQKCIDEASFYGLLYYVTGDMLILDDDSTGAMVFNKQLIADYNLDMPYDLVQEGAWTMDKMGEMAGTVASDVNGNGTVELQEDRFGILWQRDAIVSFMHGCEVRLVDKNEEGEPVFVIGSERAIDAFDKLDSMFFDPAVVQNIHNYEGKISGDLYVAEANVFRENNALFMWIRMRVAENLRDMETDFGIIPVPKFDEQQKTYYSTITKYTAATVCIPNSSAFDLDVTGAVVELMSAEGHYDLREAYYDINLGTKVSRDPQSTEMLSLIIENRVYDAGEIYSIGSVADQLYSASQGSSIGLATLLARSEKLMNRMLEKNFVEKLKALAEAAGN